MSTVCRIGVKYIAEKMDEQQQRLDQALTASVQANPKAGMQGQPLPYQLRSDAFVTGIILIRLAMRRRVPFRPVFLFAEKRKEICAATDKGALPV